MSFLRNALETATQVANTSLDVMKGAAFAAIAPVLLTVNFGMNIVDGESFTDAGINAMESTKEVISEPLSNAKESVVDTVTESGIVMPDGETYDENAHTFNEWSNKKNRFSELIDFDSQRLHVSRLHGITDNPSWSRVKENEHGQSLHTLHLTWYDHQEVVAYPNDKLLVRVPGRSYLIDIKDVEAFYLNNTFGNIMPSFASLRVPANDVSIFPTATRAAFFITNAHYQQLKKEWYELNETPFPESLRAPEKLHLPIINQ